MDATIHQNLQDLVAVKRLLTRASELEAQRKDPRAKVRSLKETFEEDQVALSGETSAVHAARSSKSSQMENENINLRDLITRLDQVQGQKGEQNGGVQVAFQETVTIVEKLEINYDALTPVDGLVVRNPHLAETDRYRFEFSDGTTLRIVDKWAGKSTTIWGDPHIDLSDIEGSLDGDFKDLTGSDSHTTFILKDGTRLTITARDAGIIEAVDIFKHNQHAVGIGAGAKSWSDKNGFFNLKVDSGTLASGIPMGDVVYAGGDGNDWYNASQKLIWGKATGPEINFRPSALLTVNYLYTEKREVAVNVNRGV